ncbi:histidine kinase [Frankia sp. AgPm24]|uniref:MHYT domain-containing protein n=1 Tax=Frankia sp. AgPm24 TaxID=631128 RepID=UPI00200E6A52|nr:MHYT domain-containing protein [Frankia sp. AgPm24]MCK9923264.1 histidine kinase [Frankia sp. AgPm24]
MIVAAAVHQHASQDLLFVAVSIGLALIGSFAALVSAIRIPLSAGRERVRWTGAAAVSLGGGAIWSMHFIGMIGYQVSGLDLRYGLPYTGLSLLIAVGASALGLTLVARHPHSLGWLGASGLVAGLGVAAMHYTGMAAMHTGGEVTYRVSVVALSVAIAVAAATAALWIAFRVRTGRHVVFASMVMAAAVCGMHYTAMAATRVSADPALLAGDDLRIDGADPIALAPIVCVIAFSVLAVVIFTAMGGVTESGALSMARTGQVRPVAPVIPVPTYSDEYLPPAPVPVWRGSFSEPPSSH